MTDRDRLLHLLVERSLRLGDFVLASGARSSYYIDCRTTTTHAEGQHLCGVLGLRALREAALDPDAVGGLTRGGRTRWPMPSPTVAGRSAPKGSRQ